MAHRSVGNGVAPVVMLRAMGSCAAWSRGRSASETVVRDGGNMISRRRELTVPVAVEVGWFFT